MGSSASKPETVFHGETPVRFSSNLLETLQNSSETDSTREKALEIHIQERVATELRRLEQRESDILTALEQEQKGVTTIDGDKDFLKEGSAAADEGGLDRNKVQQEIDALRQRLHDLPKVQELQAEMKAAREGVVSCLRRNEARPLDCWKEVENFKEQTRRLEKAFVVRTVGRDY